MNAKCRMISSTASRATRNEMSLTPLKDPMFILLLKEFKNLLKSNIGPTGNSMLLVSGGGYVQLSSSSLHIVQNYDQFRSPIIQFITQIMKSQTDFGLYCGVFISSCLEHFLSLQCSDKITPKQSILILNFIIKSCYQIFDSETLKIRVSFDSVSDFIPIVKSVLESKCKTISIDNSFISKLSVQIVKAFLFSLDDECMRLGRVSVKVFRGIDEVKFYPGIIYQLSDDNYWMSNLVLQKFQYKTEVKTLLFTGMLDCEDSLNNEYSDDNKLSNILKILDEAVKLGVNIIACQKVVHCEIVLFMRRKSVIILERMGTELALNFEQLTGSFPISSIVELDLTDLPQMSGIIDKVSSIEIGNDCYLLMERNSISFSTLILRTSCLSSKEQIKVLVEQALTTLQALIKHPYVCPGAGCFEVCLWARIQAFCKESTFGEEAQWLLSTLIEASGNSFPIWIDTLFMHMWASEDHLRCKCQLLSRDTVIQNGGSYELLSLQEGSFGFNFSDSFDNPHQITELCENAVVDSFVLKRNSIISSLESCVNLLGIGSVLFVKNC